MSELKIEVGLKIFNDEGQSYDVQGIDGDIVEIKGPLFDWDAWRYASTKSLFLTKSDISKNYTKTKCHIKQG